VQADVSNWFQNADGTALLDPSNAANATAINDNIDSSFQLN
jgi:hypothetical protein